MLTAHIFLGVFLGGRVRGVGGVGGALTCSRFCRPATFLLASDERAAVGDLGFLPAAGQKVKPKARYTSQA